MEEKVTYILDQSEIHVQKMNLTVINRHPQYLRKPQPEVKRQIEVQLYRIFHKYA